MRVKFRSPLRNLLALPLVAATMMSGLISPLPVAQADPATQDSDTAAVASAVDFSPMRLQKSNGVSVYITSQMQRNAAVVLDTIARTNWSGVSPQDKDRLMVMSLMTMAQESTFFTNPKTFTPDRYGDVGPFQLRAWIGWHADANSVSENTRILNDIPYATRTFIEGHRVSKRVSGAAGPVGYVIPGVFQKSNWRTEEMWKVIANVQVPAVQYRYYYEYWRPVAEAMVKKLAGRIPSSSHDVDVYTTAGEHNVNGRHWRTTCEAYTSSIDRCRAEIWSTQVSKVNGRFVPSNDWHFNNLTYLPSSRAEWKGNPLANSGEFTSNGRAWKTSCADAWTGPDACRSFIKSNEIEAYLDNSGNRRYREVEKWVFNNIVKFSN